ncbi:TSUP family transporter [Streptomyces sp. NPDC005879]|uniref:TSUP family transporter n=1 Tax=Streptomyces sp. NPDC005879 TaxID=3154567 RepID=UPI0033F20CB2
MDYVMLVGVGCLTGVTTVLFGFGGGFVAVPVVVAADASLGGDAMRVATATSALVMVVNAGFATAVTPRRVLFALRGSGLLLVLLAAGAAAGAFATRLAPDGPARWAFVAYVLLTIADLLLRPGFLRTYAGGEVPGGAESDDAESGRASSRGVESGGAASRGGPRPLPAAVGAPIGAVAAFLGVGGSVMTVPAMRRAGHPMRVATSLANPLTLAIALPATAVSLASAAVPTATDARVHLVGLLDVGAAAALLAGALPVIAALRRRPPRIPDRAHAWAYIGLLALVALAMLLLA